MQKNTDLLKEANEFVNKEKETVNDTLKGVYHFSPQIGWMNDPNGFSYFQGEYHLFYQYHPYSSKWGPMYWGHAKSNDLVHWEHLPVALAPNEEYDKDGCYSGSAIVRNGRLYLMYTGHVETENGVIETQNIAWSEDGIHFKKYEKNPVIDGSMLPKEASLNDFRDPTLWEDSSVYYAAVGSKTEKGGQVLVFKSKDLMKWEYHSTSVQGNSELGTMWECPQYVFYPENTLLLTSAQLVKAQSDKYHNISSSIYMTGDYDAEDGKFTPQLVDEVDYGFDFYAPQVVGTPDGRKIMIAWMQMWGRNIPSDFLKHKWAGSATLPREICIENGVLVQRPIREMEARRVKKTEYIEKNLEGTKMYPDVSGNCMELELTVDMTECVRFGIHMFKDESCETVLYYDVQEKKLVLDRRNNGQNLGGDPNEMARCGVRKTLLELKGNCLKLRLFLDKTSLEVFAGEGERTMTSTVYPEQGANKLEFVSIGKATYKLTKYDLDM